MGKMVYNLLVLERNVPLMEKLLDQFQVGYYDWDKSKVFILHGCRLVNYTMLCDAETHKSIETALHNSV